MSFSHDWMIKFAVVEYPPMSLFLAYAVCRICAAIYISYPGEYIAEAIWLALAMSCCWGRKMLLSLASEWCFWGMDVSHPLRPVAKCEWCRWCTKAYVASLTSSFSKKALPATGILCDSPEMCTTPAPHLAFTVLGKILNASLCNSSRYEVGCWGWGISGTNTLLFLDILQKGLLSLQQSRKMLDFLRLCFNILTDRGVVETGLRLESDVPLPSPYSWPTVPLFLAGLGPLLIPVSMRPSSELSPAVNPELIWHCIPCPPQYCSKKAPVRHWLEWDRVYF